MTKPERWHGTAGGYSNHACRCDEEIQQEGDVTLFRSKNKPDPPNTIKLCGWCYRYIDTCINSPCRDRERQ